MVAHRIADPGHPEPVGKVAPGGRDAGWRRRSTCYEGSPSRRSGQSRACERLPALRARPLVREEVQGVVPGRGVPGQVRRRFRGRCFQYKRDAERLDRSPENTRMEKFQLGGWRPRRPACCSSGDSPAKGWPSTARSRRRSSSFGFKHVCGTDLNGKTAIVRIPSTKSCRKFLDRTHEWLKRHLHWKRPDQQRHLASMLRGFYQYFASTTACRSSTGCSVSFGAVAQVVAAAQSAPLHVLELPRKPGRGSNCLGPGSSTRRSDVALCVQVLGSPLQEICTAGSARGDEFVKLRRLG